MTQQEANDLTAQLEDFIAAKIAQKDEQSSWESETALAKARHNLTQTFINLTNN